MKKTFEKLCFLCGKKQGDAKQFIELPHKAGNFVCNNCAYEIMLAVLEAPENKPFFRGTPGFGFQKCRIADDFWDFRLYTLISRFFHVGVIPSTRKLFIEVIKGSLELNEKQKALRDSARRYPQNLREERKRHKAFVMPHKRRYFKKTRKLFRRRNPEKFNEDYGEKYQTVIDFLCC